jgi:hypothetical protein
VVAQAPPPLNTLLQKSITISSIIEFRMKRKFSLAQLNDRLEERSSIISAKLILLLSID